MNLRRTSYRLVFLFMVAAVGVGCASSGSSVGTAGVMSGLEDCSNLYPPVTSGYGYPAPGYSNYGNYGNYGGAFYDDDGLCSAYPRLYGYYPEYIVQETSSRQVTSAEARDHHGRVVSRGEPQGWGSRSADGSSGSSSSSSDRASVPRMEPVLVNSPSSSPGSSGPGTVTVQPHEH